VLFCIPPPPKTKQNKTPTTPAVNHSEKGATSKSRYTGESYDLPQMDADDF